jgi:hypothetical protein
LRPAGVEITREIDLHELLRGMRPVLSEVAYAIGFLPPGTLTPRALRPFAVVHEDEEQTIVAAAADLAGSDVEHSSGWAKITLTVHSSLSAVGLTARISSALAEQGVSATVVAGYVHDTFSTNGHDVMRPWVSC